MNIVNRFGAAIFCIAGWLALFFLVPITLFILFGVVSGQAFKHSVVIIDVVKMIVGTLAGCVVAIIFIRVGGEGMNANMKNKDIVK